MTTVYIIGQENGLNVLRQKRDAVSVKLLPPVVADVLSEDLDLAGVGLHKSRRSAYGSRFAGSVPAEQAEYLSLSYRKAQCPKDISPVPLVSQINLPEFQRVILFVGFGTFRSGTSTISETGTVKQRITRQTRR